MSNMKNVHAHLREAHKAHRQSQEDALREAAVARAEAEAAAAAVALSPDNPPGGDNAGPV
jgi:hypothetical protein